jgi:large subunit ribosomal protein L4
MQVEIINLFDDKQSKDKATLNPDVFDLEIRRDILHKVIRWQLAKRRLGSRKTKVMSEISGTTKKPFKQKGTGNARAGTLRAAQMRGGVTIHGPKVRSHEFSLTKKLKKLALRIALSVKVRSNKLLIVDNLNAESAKTAFMHSVLKKHNLSSVLFIDGEQKDKNFELAIKNIPCINIIPQIGANVYDIIRHENVVLTKQALKMLEERLQ